MNQVSGFREPKDAVENPVEGQAIIAGLGRFKVVPRSFRFAFFVSSLSPEAGTGGFALFAGRCQLT